MLNLQVSDLSVEEIQRSGGLCRIGKAAHRATPIKSVRVFERTLEPTIAEGLASISLVDAKSLRFANDVLTASTAFRENISPFLSAPDWLADWLCHDVDFLARMFQQLTGARQIIVRFEIVSDDACRRFHIDNVRFRLLTTYRGPGTEWVDPDDPAYPSPLDMPTLERLRRQLPPGHIIIMRGAAAETEAAPALMHRSPRIAGRGLSRLVLAIDDARGHPHLGELTQ